MVVLFDRLIELMTDRLLGRCLIEVWVMIDSLTDWLICCEVARWIDWLGWLIGLIRWVDWLAWLLYVIVCLIDWYWLINWLSGCLIDDWVMIDWWLVWWIDWVSDWVFSLPLIDRSVIDRLDWLVDCLIVSVDCLIDRWLIGDWLIDWWLNGWLIDDCLSID